ncbi:MAG: sucrase ferredoxin [Anaerolineales bacterium]
MTSRSPEYFSCDSSLAAGEPLVGKGTTGTRWLLLEADTPWPQRAIAEKELPQGVTEKLVDFKGADQCRVQFFRGDRSLSEGIRLMLARTDLVDRPLRCMELTSYEELLDLDLHRLFDEPVPPEEEHEPVILVCTNGMRDPCCAREGTNFYQALAELDKQHVFQTTHLGGHRFAANVLWLPYGVYYSRLKPDQATELLELAGQEKILLSNLRGRVNLPKPAQAADHFLRQEGGWRGLHEVKFLSLEGEEPNWRASFKIEPANETAEVEIALEPEVFRVYKTTGDDELSLVGQYHCRYAS